MAPQWAKPFSGIKEASVLTFNHLVGGFDQSEVLSSFAGLQALGFCRSIFPFPLGSKEVLPRLNWTVVLN